MLILILSGVFIADQWYQRSSSQSQNRLLIELSEALCNDLDCNTKQQLSRRVSVYPYTALAINAQTVKTADGYELMTTSDDKRHWLYIIPPDKKRVFRVDTTQESDGLKVYTGVFYFILALALFLLTLPFFIAFFRIKASAEYFAVTRDQSVWLNKKSFLFQSIFDAMAYMSSRLTHAIALQRELSNTLSHEARTIISRIKLTLSSLDIPQHEIMLFEQDLNELEILSDEFLRLSKYEHEILPDIVNINIAQMLQELVTPYRRFSTKQVSIYCEERFVVQSDERLLRWAIRNLIDNGIKYAESEVIIRVCGSNNDWQFTIEDNGPGVSYTKIQELFLPFCRPDNSIKKGYGYGLAIVMKATELLQGDISIRPAKELNGSCFVLRFTNGQADHS
ncbi:HAMP domain-containing sensor histidine kinase [Pseudoalteromonas piscicida]|uniref:sensor histidine kinase n=1 Tax=Pseudoalteromonas piscicida TaxID=43662 RepID=UPI0030A821B4